MYIPKRLISAIATKDYAAVEAIRAKYSYTQWSKLYVMANNAVNALSYNFLSLDAKVISKSADKSYVSGIEPRHNED